MMDLKDVCPKSAVVFIIQMLTALVVIIIAGVNLTLHQDNNPVWVAMLCSAVGFVFPTPALKKKKCENP
jgi:energy-converting hydrogenase Eha subunit A